jgi:hypothetical protein
MNYLTLTWHSPTAGQTLGATVYIEGDGSLHEELFWVWNDVSSLTLSATGIGVINPRLSIEEIALYEGDPSEVP